MSRTVPSAPAPVRFDRAWRLAAAAAALGALAWLVLRTGADGNAPPEDGRRASGTRTSLLPDAAPDWNALDDPGRDGWASEDFSARASARLSELARLVERGAVAPSDLRPLAAVDFPCGTLRPAAPAVVFEDRRVEVRRAEGGGASEDERTTLAEALAALLAPLADAREVHAKFKLFDVVPADGGYLTRQYLSLSATTGAGRYEQNATWRASWTDEEEPRLRLLVMESLEEVVSAGGPLFTDCTASVLGDTPGYESQLLVGLHTWLGRIESTRELALFGHPGIALGDVDGDGLDDLYLCQESGLPNRLFVQRPDGTARDVSAEAGVDWLDDSRGALLVDLDDDGDQDLAVAVWGAVVLAENDGAARFEVRAAIPASRDLMSLSAVDYDLDGDLDLYVCGYNADFPLGGEEASVFASVAEDFVFHDANNGAPNHLLRNARSDGAAWSFEDVTHEVGLDEQNRRYSFAAAWEDVDDDGDSDLYVANDYGRDNLYRNDGGRFVEVSDRANVEDSAGGMSITWGDYDRDGRRDAFVSNMFSAAGSRVTRQPSFKPEAPAVKERLRHFARGNTLLRNLGAGRFEDTTLAAGVEMGRWAWGARFADLDNDGWEDLVVTNGYMTGGGDGDL